MAGTNIPVAKHGNYSATSKSGAANVLKSLSVNIDCELDIVERCLDEIGICFLLAPKHHIAMKYVGKIRQEMGIRTIFNLLGPLSNPALVKKQLLGVYDKSLILQFDMIADYQNEFAVMIFEFWMDFLIININ